MTNVRTDLLEENARLKDQVEQLQREVGSLRQQLDRAPLPLSSEQMYESIFRLSPNIITVTRFEDGTYYDVNDAFCRITGVSREEANSSSSLELGLWENPTDRERVKALLQQDTAYVNEEIDYRIRGGIMHALQSAECVTIGSKRYIIAITTDITELKRTQDALMREQKRLSVIIRSHSDGVIVTYSDERVGIMNPAAARILGVQEPEAIGMLLSEVLDLRDPKTGATITNLQKATANRGILHGHEGLLLVGKNGVERRVEIELAPIVVRDGVLNGSVLLLHDITERLRWEEQLRKSNRLESLGTLAGGIAHDFNNLLMGIRANIGFLQGARVSPEDRREALTDIESAVLQGRELTQQLLTFSRGGAPVKQGRALDELIEQVCGFVLRGSGVRFSLDVDQDVQTANVDRSQIAQVIENIVVNAHQAMPSGGSLRARIGNVAVLEGSSLPLEHGSYVHVSFEDDGPGIAPEDLPRIFDPFFTKRPGGTGLGLSIVHSIIERHGGCILARSDPHQGARFDIYLPATQSSETPEDRPSQPRRGKEKVLWMDDDEAIRRSVERFLAQLGYRVDVFAEGSEAVTAYRNASLSGDPYAIVFLDLTVAGGMGGKETARLIRDFDPKAKIVVSSGYSDDDILANPWAHGFDTSLAKPCDTKELWKILRELLET